MKYFVAVIFLAVPLFAQPANQVILQNADVFAGKRLENGEDVRELTGNVRFRQGNTRVWCDRAIQFLNRNEIELIGSVRIIRDTVTLTARKGRYFGNSRRADGEGNVKLQTPNVTLYADLGTYYLDDEKAFFQRNVRVVDSATVIYADQLTYFEKERRSEAILNVRIVNTGNNVTMYGNYLIHSDSTGYSRMTEQPRLMQIDTSETGVIDTLAVRSIVMESFDDSTQMMIVKDSVVIVRGALAARSGRVKFFRREERIELFERPIVWYEENQVTGDTIYLLLKENRLTEATVRNRAFVISQSDSLFPERYNQLTGRWIHMMFHENKLRETTVDRNAISLYFLYEDSVGNGVNKTSGDRIFMAFDEGRPRTIRVFSGIEGTYFPENMLRRDPSQFNLEGFQLRSDRPTMSSIFPRRPQP